MNARPMQERSDKVEEVGCVWYQFGVLDPVETERRELVEPSVSIVLNKEGSFKEKRHGKMDLDLFLMVRCQTRTQVSINSYVRTYQKDMQR
jgi:hypothetical protein